MNGRIKMNKLEKAPTISIQASGFPLASFKEWDESCKTDFGDCRWVKIIHDHNMAKASTAFNLLLERIEKLELQLDLLSKDDKTKEEKELIVKTIGGELK